MFWTQPQQLKMIVAANDVPCCLACCPFTLLWFCCSWLLTGNRHSRTVFFGLFLRMQVRDYNHYHFDCFQVSTAVLSITAKAKKKEKEKEKKEEEKMEVVSVTQWSYVLILLWPNSLNTVVLCAQLFQLFVLLSAYRIISLYLKEPLENHVCVNLLFLLL